MLLQYVKAPVYFSESVMEEIGNDLEIQLVWALTNISQRKAYITSICEGTSVL